MAKTDETMKPFLSYVYRGTEHRSGITQELMGCKLIRLLKCFNFEAPLYPFPDTLNFQSIVVGFFFLSPTL